MKRTLVGILLVVVVILTVIFVLLRDRGQRVSKAADGHAPKDSEAMRGSPCEHDLSSIVRELMACSSKFAKVNQSQIDKVIIGFLGDPVDKQMWCRVQFGEESQLPGQQVIGAEQVIMGEIADLKCYEALSGTNDSIRGLASLCPALAQGVSIDGMVVVVRYYRNVLSQYYGIQTGSVNEPDLNSAVVHIDRMPQAKKVWSEPLLQPPEDIKDLPGPTSPETSKFKVKPKKVR